MHNYVHFKFLFIILWLHSEDYGHALLVKLLTIKLIALICGRLFNHNRLGLRSEYCELESVYSYQAAPAESEHGAHTARHKVTSFLI